MRSMQLGFYDRIIKTVVQSYSGYVQVHANGYWEKQSVNNSMEVDEILIDEINSIGNVDTQVATLKDLIVAYNTAELDFDVSLGEGEEGEDEDEEGGDDEEDEEEDE